MARTGFRCQPRRVALFRKGRIAGQREIGREQASCSRKPSTNNALVNRLIWRLMPLLTIMFLVSFIDRQNVGFAKLQMVGALHTTEDDYGFASSLFFIAYLALEIPSTLAVHKFGARVWMARIMLTWGLVTVLQAFCSSLVQFDILRCLLGVAEAGLYPGILFYMTLWFPQKTPDPRAGPVHARQRALPMRWDL